MTKPVVAPQNGTIGVLRTTLSACVANVIGGCEQSKEWQPSIRTSSDSKYNDRGLTLRSSVTAFGLNDARQFGVLFIGDPALLQFDQIDTFASRKIDNYFVYVESLGSAAKIILAESELKPPPTLIDPSEAFVDIFEPAATDKLATGKHNSQQRDSTRS